LTNLRADGGLGAENFFSRTREAALPGHFEKCDQLIEVHGLFGQSKIIADLPTV
jgi:hypothetical protein